VIFVTDRVEKVIRPSKGRPHLRRILRELYAFEPKGSGTKLAAGLDWLLESVRRRAVVFMFSDFQDEGFEEELRLCAHRHDVVLVDVTDRRELDLPKFGLVELQDAETGEIHQVDCRSAAVRHAFATLTAEHHLHIAQICRDLNIDLFRICTERDYLHDLITFFRTRRRRRADA
jgi:uncharacterized protein (DUF58 family)